MAHFYRRHEETRNTVRYAMALSMLPEEVIRVAFRWIDSLAVTEPAVTFVDYVKKYWVNSKVWPPSTWSVHRMRVRSNSNVEGNLFLDDVVHCHLFSN